MKKLFIAVLAVAGLASCMQDEVISQDQAAIEFGDAFVDNATKVIYDDDNKVTAFQVWGTVTGENNTVALYQGANVYNGTAYNTAWTCDVTRYWTENCKYAFYAVVDSNVTPVQNVPANANVKATDGVVKSIEYVADGKNDLLYGATTATTGDEATGNIVAFTMQHLLSKITFSVTNPDTNPADYLYNVKSITVAGAYGSGTYTVDHNVDANTGLPKNINGTYAGTWVGTETMDALSFTGVDALAKGNTHSSAEAFVIIPGNPALTITIKTETVFGGKVIATETHILKVNDTDPANDKDTEITFLKNYHYNFAVALPTLGNPIKFSINTVGDFDTPNETPIQ